MHVPDALVRRNGVLGQLLGDHPPAVAVHERLGGVEEQHHRELVLIPQPPIPAAKALEVGLAVDGGQLDPICPGLLPQVAGDLSVDIGGLHAWGQPRRVEHHEVCPPGLETEDLLRLPLGTDILDERLIPEELDGRVPSSKLVASCAVTEGLPLAIQVVKLPFVVMGEPLVGQLDPLIRGAPSWGVGGGVFVGMQLDAQPPELPADVLSARAPGKLQRLVEGARAASRAHDQEAE
mmetsp:Transcript_9325/g.26230  ORF Transcript_9325/g.26230 Transcript_9325/m.26230 type:complete len:235 (+) Transcript_9325:654-1358(+)